MKSKATKQFWQLLDALPLSIQRQARDSYRLWQDNPRHPSVRFKRVHPVEPIYSARVNNNYRALGLLDEDTIIWFWIGNHGVYDRLLKQL